ncbi:MAG: SusD/RagB family nutrient-binding outer membrane lipoprotein [Bacteroidales bacterium]|nr:SusD/RagB family nutrient-binding outer membrane lipoprotein [Bacteroidales bacterium]
MKYFIKYNKVFLALAMIFTVGSCTKDFEEMNTSPNSPTDVPSINIFTHVITASVGRELGGWIQHTYLGCWCQQWAKVQYIDEDKYQPRDMTGDMEGIYTNQLFDLQVIIDKTTAEIEAENQVPSNTALLAAAKIMRVWVFSFLTDLFGDIPYSEALQGLYADGIITPKYDTQESIYTAFFNELEEANTLLGSGVINFGSGDLIFGGDPAKWKKFGNSLKLRLLNRCAGTPWSFTYNMVGTGAFTTTAGAAAYSGADAAIAAILSDPTGHPIMTSNADNVYLDYPGLPYRNPIYNTLYTRTDQGIAETIVEYLKARNDPRLPVYAQPSPKYVDGDTTVAYTGTQNGLAHAASDFNIVSLLGTAVAYDENAPVYILTYDEVEFIKAEHLMRTGGAAQAAYEAGIAASMERWDATYDAATYLAQPNVDWAQAATDGEKYQLICEQRWTGIFGQGVQAYNLVRRTGFPARVFEFELEAAFYPDLGFPVRIRYSINEETYNAVNLQAAQNSQGLNLLNETMFNTPGTTSNQVWWHTRLNPVPTEIDPPVWQ